jgi:hypothetical protein
LHDAKPSIANTPKNNTFFMIYSKIIFLPISKLGLMS